MMRVNHPKEFEAQRTADGGENKNEKSASKRRTSDRPKIKNFEIESRLYLNLSTRAISFEVKKSFILMTPVSSTLPYHPQKSHTTYVTEE
jgi:hypothetical protein